MLISLKVIFHKNFSSKLSFMSMPLMSYKDNCSLNYLNKTIISTPNQIYFFCMKKHCVKELIHVLFSFHSNYSNFDYAGMSIDRMVTTLQCITSIKYSRVCLRIDILILKIKLFVSFYA